MGIYYIWFDGRIIFKLIPMALIIILGLIYVTSQKPKQRYHYLTVVGLLFCILGDYLISQVFVSGLVAFLIGHIFYIFSFRQQKQAEPDKVRFIILAYALIMMTIMSIALINKGDLYLVLPVIIYTAVIALMVYTAWRTRSNWLIVGSILFLISDSILAWNRFVSDISYSSVLIMTTYYAANYFIATSLKAKS